MKKDYMTRLERAVRWRLPPQEAEDVIADYREIVGNPPRSEEELLKSMRMLARIHKAARGVWNAEDETVKRLLGNDRRTELDKHNRELRRVQNFIRSKRKKGSFELLFLNSADSRRSLSMTAEFSLLGTSIPTAAFPGIGASIRISAAARFSLISSASPTILLTFTPISG